MSINRQQRHLTQRQDLATEAGLAAPRQGEAEERRTARPPSGAPPRRFSPRQFLHEVNVELRKVAWPTRAETANYAIVVLIALAVLMAVIFALDLGFSHLASFLFK